MSGTIRVTPEELEQVADLYGKEGVEVHEQIVRLDKMIERLEGIWEGESSKAFQDQYIMLRPSFQDMEELLESINRQLKSTAGAIRDADADIASQIRR
ncbi:MULTISPECIES: WXG100 family type VII secretion target [Bacillaceae]|uniref:ESAT-6-like protein n=1 Tax=Metabacillus endolithicus TaxID=1535204 RepID=A0ABW5BX71_9BACI|nr:MULTISPECIES: WXG100 family type VII secretion target [Bacillaceae]MCM3164009.1 WXG100 family type VII secretion target [Metabacillus litoralis]MCM3410499.1 WXG100 family type VII secretion target [Metabacillus litoralis]PGT91612.1 WXG100 family type VII secretion target [Bacillus sp. AFS040349]UHA58407.1 WXG100 family type VII secretion target [Metabacillus litoralis]UPG64038.1 WXG100 family type VII secretion target [Metabacillus endolithicus]